MAAGSLRSARCWHEKSITARARKNKRTARMLANTLKDHSIPLILTIYAISFPGLFPGLGAGRGKGPGNEVAICGHVIFEFL